MQSQQVAGLTNGAATALPPPDPFGDGSELKALRARSRRDVEVINTLRQAVSNFHSAAKALKAENAELRADNSACALQQLVQCARQPTAALRSATPRKSSFLRTRSTPRLPRHVVASPSRADPRRPIRARQRPQARPISELVTNSVRHSGVAAGEPLTGARATSGKPAGWKSRTPAATASSHPGPSDAVQGHRDGFEPRADAQRAMGRGASFQGRHRSGPLSRAAARADADFQSNGTRPSSARDWPEPCPLTVGSHGFGRPGPAPRRPSASPRRSGCCRKRTHGRWTWDGESTASDAAARRPAMRSPVPGRRGLAVGPMKARPHSHWLIGAWAPI